MYITMCMPKTLGFLLRASCTSRDVQGDVHGSVVTLYMYAKLANPMQFDRKYSHAKELDSLATLCPQYS